MSNRPAGKLAATGIPVRATRRHFLAFVAATIGGQDARLAVRPASETDVLIVAFSDAGERLGAERVAKVVKSDAEWRKLLSPLAYQVARRGDTERPFSGAYWNLHDRGLFRCVCCETALFSSDAKFDSGTGWPSFYDVIAKENVVANTSPVAFLTGSEVTCRRCDAHLGDVFDDGPRPTKLRYCIDSVSLRFVKRIAR
jgi:peptide-methionine (R)-S-oxide reductase